MNTIRYTQADMNEDLYRLKCELIDKQFDIIIGVSRGGCIPAVALSHALSIPVTMIDWSTRDGVNVHPTNIIEYFQNIGSKYRQVLIVDDIVDSGESLAKLVGVAKVYCEVTVATLLHNTEVQLAAPHYAGREFKRSEEPRYFDFWWEIV